MSLHIAITSCESCYRNRDNLGVRGPLISNARNYLLAELEKTTIGAMIRASAVDAALEACWYCENSGPKIKDVLEKMLDVSLRE